MERRRGRNGYNEKKGCIIIIAIFVIVLSIIGHCNGGGSSSRIAGTGPDKFDAMTSIRIFLKHQYLKDPDSYEGIDWGPSGIYMKENNTYYMMHKYRAKNGFGGYVVENPMFILNAQGDVVDVKTDIYDVINDGSY